MEVAWKAGRLRSVPEVRGTTSDRFRSTPPSLSLSAALFGFALAGLLSGCASTGVPRAPSLMLPQVLRAVQAERSGTSVDLRWTTPSVTTDRLPLAGRRHRAGTLTAEVCRVSGNTCDVFTRQIVAVGEAASARDILGPELGTGPARAVRYRVRILNGAGRSAGWSRDAVALAGEAPAAIAALTATTTSAGMQLTWQKAAALPGDRILLHATSVNHPDAPERTLAAPAGSGGAVDPAAATGDTLRYTVQRTRSLQVDGLTLPLNGQPATITVTVAKDTFAPAPPHGLVAVAVQMEGAPPEIDLSWEANTEPDLQGYLVYRSEAAQTGAKPVQLTTSPTGMVGYQDRTVLPGHAYRYTVVAVDRNENASAPSAPAEEQLRP